MSRHQPEAFSLTAAGHRFGIVAARFNAQYVEALLKRLLGVLREASVADEDIEVLRVPGSNEIPYAVNMMAETGEFDCLTALGVIIAGGTDHHRVIADSTSRALQGIAIDSFIPVINGILCVVSEEQAEERCLGAIDRGSEYGRSALEMAILKVRFGERLEDFDYSPDTEAFGGEARENLPWEGLDEGDADRDDWKS